MKDVCLSGMFLITAVVTAEDRLCFRGPSRQELIPKQRGMFKTKFMNIYRLYGS